MKTACPVAKAETARTAGEAAFSAFIRRLVQDAATLRAIDSGEVVETNDFLRQQLLAYAISSSNRPVIKLLYDWYDNQS